MKRSKFLTKIPHSFQMEQNSKISSLRMPSLAHTLPCLARTVPKPSPLSYIQYFIVLTDNPVLQPRGTSRRGNLSPVAGANEMLPYGVPFDSLSFLYLTPTHFFDLKFPIGNRPFFRPRFFIPRRVSNEVVSQGVPI